MLPLSQLTCCNTITKDVCCETNLALLSQDTKPIHPEVLIKPDEDNFLDIDNIKLENDMTDNTSPDEELVQNDFKYIVTVESTEIKCIDKIKKETTDSNTKSNRKRRQYTNATKVLKKKLKPQLEDDDEDDIFISKLEKSVVTKENYTVMYMNDEELKAKRESDKQSQKFRGRCKYKCEFCISWFVDQNKYDRHVTTRHSEVNQ